MNHKVLKKFSFKWQADQLAAVLNEAHIEAKILENPREYSAIVTGISGDSFSVIIHHRDFIKASEIEKELSSASEDSEVEIVPPTSVVNNKKNIYKIIFVTFVLVTIIALSL